eukprot:scaffold78_cov609-Prasinococcus_capsulatus_cf.AAC.7
MLTRSGVRMVPTACVASAARRAEGNSPRSVPGAGRAGVWGRHPPWALIPAPAWPCVDLEGREGDGPPRRHPGASSLAVP